MQIEVKFYGTRGSIPVCDPGFQEFGGNTSCIQITDVAQRRAAIVDAGTGLRQLGRDLLASEHVQDQLHLLFTHFHWDHIQGFPFFAPAYNPNYCIHLLALGEGRQIDLRGIFETLMRHEYSPVPLDQMGANFEFIRIDKASEIFQADGQAPTKVSANRHNHPGGAYGYRFERYGKVVVICTDIEHGDDIDPNVVDFARGAHLLVHEAQYTNEELNRKRGWGHSSYDQAIRVAELAQVDQLAITHHDPDHDDHFLRRMEKTCRERFSNCVFAREGMALNV